MYIRAVKSVTDVCVYTSLEVCTTFPQTLRVYKLLHVVNHPSLLLGNNTIDSKDK